MSIAQEYKNLKEAILIARDNLEKFLQPYEKPIWSYYYQLGHGRLESVEIDNITDTDITYTIQTSFRGEYDPSEQYTIPISACKTWETIKKYFDDKKHEEKIKQLEQDSLEVEQQKAAQAESEYKTYLSLKEKFENSKSPKENS